VRPAWLVLVAGCDAVFGLDTPMRPTRDGAMADAAPDGDLRHGACAGRAPAPVFCGDFDETPPLFYIAGMPTSIDLGNGVGVGSNPASGSGALSFASTGGTVEETYTAPTRSTTLLDATFAFRIDATDPSNSSQDGLFILHLDGNGTCFVGFDIVGATHTLRLDVHCAGGNTGTDVATSLPPAGLWTSAHFVLDLGAGSASIDLGAGPVSMPLGFQTATPVTPELQFGIDQSSNGLAVGFDDITVTD
jgi:hypothetical protein